MSEQNHPSELRRNLGAKLRQMRKQAHLTLELAAPKLDTTRSALHRVETGQTKANVHLVRSMMDLYDAHDPALLNEVRAANNAPKTDNRTKSKHTPGSSSVPTDQTPVDSAAPRFNAPKPLGDADEFNNLLVEMVTDQAPRIFAVVIEHGHREDAAIVAWGMAFEDNAYLVTVNGNNQYTLAAPENALYYVRTNLNTTPHLIWASPSAATTPNPLLLSRAGLIGCRE